MCQTICSYQDYWGDCVYPGPIKPCIEELMGDVECDGIEMEAYYEYTTTKSE